MALQATWIRKNMLQSPDSDHSHHSERKMSENEMRVLRSIQKLSIPDWYLNNSSRPPKILTNDTPIDLRPPSWKDMPVKKSVVCSTPLMPPRSLTVTRNGMMETEIGPATTTNQNFATYKINRISSKKQSPASRKRDSPSKNRVTEKKASKSRLMNISRTFPRISPSRKVKNINIVFPQPSKPSANLMITDLDEPETTVDMTKDSLDMTKFSEINDRCQETTNHHDKSLDSNFAEKQIRRTPNRHLTYIKPWKPSPTHSEVKFDVTRRNNFPAAESFKLRASSTPQGSPVSLFSNFDFDTMSEKENQKPPPISSFPITDLDATFAAEREKSDPILALPITDLDVTAEKENHECALISLPSISDLEITSPKLKKQPPPTSPRTKKLKINSNETFEAHKVDSSSARPTPSPRGSVGFQPRNLLRSNEEKSSNPTPISRVSPTDTSDLTGVALFNSTKKSSELESIVKRKQQSRDGKSLVREIIEELNVKCRISSQSAYSSPGSKNFVKKLVMALENGIVPASEEDEKKANSCDNSDNYRENEDEDEDYLEKDAFIESERGSEDDIKSAAASTSISYKDTDSCSNSSDTDVGSPTIKHDYEKYDWNMNFDKNVDESTITNNNNNEKKKNHNHDDTRVISPMVEKEDEESVYWIPITRYKLPRTSSLLSIMSRLSSNTAAGHRSPCVSPIDEANDFEKNYSSQQPGSSASSTLNWGATYRTNGPGAKRLLRIDETTILDSGYSDRSSARSSRSSYGEWSDYTETTQTASEIGSCYNETARVLSSTNLRISRAQIHGEPFAV